MSHSPSKKGNKHSKRALGPKRHEATTKKVATLLGNTAYKNDRKARREALQVIQALELEEPGAGKKVAESTRSPRDNSTFYELALLWQDNRTIGALKQMGCTIDPETESIIQKIAEQPYVRL